MPFFVCSRKKKLDIDNAIFLFLCFFVLLSPFVRSLSNSSMVNSCFGECSLPFFLPWLMLISNSRSYSVLCFARCASSGENRKERKEAWVPQLHCISQPAQVCFPVLLLTVDIYPLLFCWGNLCAYAASPPVHSILSLDFLCFSILLLLLLNRPSTFVQQGALSVHRGVPFEWSRDVVFVENCNASWREQQVSVTKNTRVNNWSIYLIE